MITLYGIPSCDTCRQARKSLETKGLDVSFRDVRAQPLSRPEMLRIFKAIGAEMINRRSATWRALPDDERLDDPVDLLLKYPTLMKRPLIDTGRTLTVGWDATAQSELLGEPDADA